MFHGIIVLVYEWFVVWKEWVIPTLYILKGHF